MRRQITAAIVGVTAFVLLALGIPLAIVVQRAVLDSEVVKLQARAARILTEIKLPLNRSTLDDIAHDADAPPAFSVYDDTGSVIHGDGPAEADPVVRAALDGEAATSTHGEIVVTTPITENELVVGVVRVSASLSESNSRTRRIWAIMAAAAVAALAAAWLIARRLARRLSQPVFDLAADAARLGGGSVVEPRDPTGIDEIDLLGATLAETSVRINETLARERRFSADVSHQLRTPLAGLRLRLEAATPADDAAAMADRALADLDRIEQTVAHLLAFARDIVPSSSTCRIDDVVDAAIRRWRRRLSAAGRSLTLTGTAGIEVDGADVAISQILDVLIDNALSHGAGAITVGVRRITGGVTVDVADEGTTTPDEVDLFRRGHGAGYGIGLALARSIAEAEGGRLLLTHRRPSTFSLVLLAATEPDS